MSGRVGGLLAALVAAGMFVTGCGAAESAPAQGLVSEDAASIASPTASPPKTEPAELLRNTDPCALLPRDALSGGGTIAQYGSAVQLSVCAALLARGGDGELTRIELSLLPSALGVSAFRGKTEVDGVEVFNGDGADLAAGRCQRLFALDLDAALEKTHYASLRVAGLAGEDVCPLADELLGDAVTAMKPGLPTYPSGPSGEARVQDPCAVADAVDGARVASTRSVDPLTPYECHILVPGADGATDVTVAFSLRAAATQTPTDPDITPTAVGDRCQWSRPTGPEIDITVDPTELDSFTQDLGRANVVVTVHGVNCEAVTTVAQAANNLYL